MKQRQLLTLDETALKAMAKKWQTRIESSR
jgi:hypothetical protein